MSKNIKEVVLNEPEPPVSKDTVIVEEDAPVMADQIVDETQDNVFVLPKNATMNSDGTVTLRLRHPVSVQVQNSSKQVRTDTFKELIFRPLTGADLRAVQATSPEMQNIVLFARSTKVREQIMNVIYDKLDAADVLNGADIIKVFMDGGRLKKS